VSALYGASICLHIVVRIDPARERQPRWPGRIYPLELYAARHVLVVRRGLLFQVSATSLAREIFYGELPLKEGVSYVSYD
jgi:hypothetical protein